MQVIKYNSRVNYFCFPPARLLFIGFPSKYSPLHYLRVERSSSSSSSSGLLSEQPALNPCVPRPSLLCLRKQILKYLAGLLSACPPDHLPLLITFLSSAGQRSSQLDAAVGISYFSPPHVNPCFVPLLSIKFSLDSHLLYVVRPVA